MWPFVSFPSKLSMNRAWRRWGNFPLVFKLLETYMSPHIPCLILLPALLTDVLRRRFIPVSGSVCVCIIVCVSQEALRGAGCGAEGVFQSSCTSVGCISLGVPCFLVVREGYHPYHFFLKLSYFLPLIAHNKLPVAHTLSCHRKPDRGFRQPLERGRWGLIWLYLLTWLHSLSCLSGLNKGCALCLGHVYYTIWFNQSTQNYL